MSSSFRGIPVVTGTKYRTPQGFSAIKNNVHAFGPYNDRARTTYKPFVDSYADGRSHITTLQFEGKREGIDDIRYATAFRQRLEAVRARGTAEQKAAAETAAGWFEALEPGRIEIARRERDRRLAERCREVGHDPHDLLSGAGMGGQRLQVHAGHDGCDQHILSFCQDGRKPCAGACDVLGADSQEDHISQPGGGGQLCRGHDGIGFLEMGKALGMIGAAVFLGLVGFIFLMWGVTYLLNKPLEMWLAAGIVGLALLIIGGIVGMVGKNQMQEANFVPEQTIESVKEDKEWASHQINSVKR